ncbi:MAG: SpoIIE family protein phosphatase, partial [candidate division Zixibacteria bacterium]|nr:SpoIIE family protein phosphatase [candidate division Zixibacteria bacterium]
TDGITEALNRDGKQYGFDRLRNFFHDELKHKAVPSATLSDRLINEIDNFCGVGKQNDDITFIVARMDRERLPDAHVSGRSMDMTEPKADSAPE